MLRTSLDDDEPRRRRGSLLLRCPYRRSTLGGKRVDHVFFEIVVSSSCVESLICTVGAFPFLTSFSSLCDQTSIPEDFVPPKFWPNPDGPINLQPTVVSDSGLRLGRDWAFNSTARPSSPKIASTSALSSPGQSIAITFAGGNSSLGRRRRSRSSLVGLRSFWASLKPTNPHPTLGHFRVGFNRDLKH